MESLFWESFPQYLSIGMSSDEFWHGDLRLCRAYRQAYRAEREREDVRQWKAGAYAYRALLAAANAYREWSAGPENPYPEAPLFGSAEARKASERASERRKLAEDKAWMETFAAQFNARFESEKNQS